MKKTITFFKTMLLAVLLFAGSNVAWGQTITITQSSSGITASSYDSGAERTWTQSGVGFGAKAVFKQGGQAALQFQASNGVIYNTTEFAGNITSIKITQTGTARACTLYGYTARIVNSTSANYSINSSATSMGTTTTSSSTITFSGLNKYFALKVPGNATYISEIVITYEVPTCTTPTYSFNASNVNKLTSDAVFTNAFTSNNTSTKVWSSTNEAVATVDAAGEVTIHSAGTTSIKVNQAADATYCAVVDASYSLTVTTPAVAEPTNHPSSFTATTNSTSQITVTWTDATGGQVPASYLVIASTGTPTAPIDGTAQADAALVKNITQGTQQAVFTGLSTSTTYNFSIWPYTNSGAAIDYKTDGAPTANATTATPLGTPVATAATDISATGFTANWGAAASATGYDVNVYTKTAGAVASDLFISEYTEGSSSNKYIEIFNGTGSSVDLSDYKLQLYGNGATSTTNDITLSGILENGATVVYKNSGASLTLPSGVTATSNAAVNYNGDDAVALYKISTSSYVDIFGRIGEDPGTSWGTSPLITAEKTLVRKSNITGGVTSNPSSGFPTLATEWDSYSQDVATYLGSHTMAGSSSSTPISGSPFTVIGTTNKVVSGLSSSTAYYYTVVAKDAEISSEASNEITVFTAIDGTVDASTLPDCATCDLVVNDGGEVTLNASKSYHSVSVKPRAKLTLNNGHAFTPGTFVLESDATGTATFVDKRTNGNKTSITATVKQYLPAAAERLWWYLASPVSDDASTVFGSNKVGEYSETTRSYSSPFGEATTLVAGKGYVVKMTAASASNYVFSNKAINTGDISIGVTLTVTETADNSKRGFNLVGNPYPSYLNWDMAYNASTNVRPSIWYRTLDNGSMTFHTYNATLGASVPSTASGYIPPMQAFWVKVDTDPVSPATVSNGTINLTNDMRSHNESGTGNPLKAPAVERPLIRLAISNGSMSDETVIVAHASALDSYDSFDSEKMSNENTNIAEIYSLAGNHELVINGISPMVPGQEIVLGLRPGKAGDFSISGTQIDNIPTDMKVILKDKLTGAETELSENASYNFSSDAAETNQRFSLLFRAPGSVTGTDLINKSTLLVYAQQSEIVVNSADLKGSNITVYTATGQSVLKTVATANREVLNGNFTTGVYFVKVNNAVRKVNVR